MKTKTRFSIPHGAIAAVLLAFAAVSASAAMKAEPPTDSAASVSPVLTQAAPAPLQQPASSAPPAAPQAVSAAQQPMAQAAPLPNEDIRDIRGPVHIPSYWPWIMGAASGAALLAAGYGAWHWSRKRRRALLPFEIALAKLEAARPLMQPETAREFSIAVSEVARAFIEECFPVRAAHRTTDEFLHDLASQADSPLAAHHETFEHFLNLCDLAKFARWHLAVPQMEAMLESARAFVLSIGAPVKSQPAAPAPEPALTTP